MAVPICITQIFKQYFNILGKSKIDTIELMDFVTSILRETIQYIISPTTSFLIILSLKLTCPSILYIQKTL